MNKKFLSAILFGALMVTSTGTFVSCKDYDDDIENLQTQINSLATKSDVEAKLSQLQTAIDAAKAEAIAAAKAADESAEIAALEAEIAALETCKCDVDAMMAKIQDAVDADMAEYKAEIEALIEKVEGYVGEISDLVTDVELILTDGKAGSGKLTFITATQVKNDGFGPNKELTFTKDLQTNFGGSVYARVSPTNAVPAASMISFINSRGEDLSSLIEVGTPKKYEGALTTVTRAAATGLWEIPYNVKAYTSADLKAAKYVNGADDTKGCLAYALAINNLSSTENGIRNVVSGYDLGIDNQTYVGTDALYFKAGGKLVSTLKNRYGANSQKEYKWKSSLKASNRVTIDDEGTDANVDTDTDDNRTDKNYLSVKVGVPFDVVLTDAEGEALAADKKAYRFYVALDKAYAEADSEPSEINAWDIYAEKTTGLNVLDTDGKVTITINSAAAEGDMIGYRVYAVNYDGSLVDPDGKAFYVYVGNGEAVAASLTLAAEIKSPYNWTTYNSTDKAAFSTSSWGRATKWTLASIADPTAENVDVMDDLGITLTNFKFYKSDKTDAVAANGTAVTNVEYVAMEGVTAANLKDGVTYVATIKATNANGDVVATATVSFKKELPAFPSAIVYPFTNVLQNDVLHIYPVKSSDTDMAEFNMTNVWHGLTTTEWAKANQVNFIQVLTDAQKEALAEGEYPAITYTAANDLVKVSDDIVDPNNDEDLSDFYLTEFPVNVVYEYGEISYKQVDGNWKKDLAWSPVGNEIKMVFRNYAADCEIEWAGDVPTLFYPGASGKKDYISLSALKVTDWYGNSVNLAEDNDYFETANVSIILLTGDDVENEYYKAEIVADYEVGVDENGDEVYDDVILFTSKVNKSQGSAVPTTLKVVIKDNFGYEVSKSDLAPFSMSFTK